MPSTLRTPTERACERCGRREVWDEDVGTWRVADPEEGVHAGDGSETGDDDRPVGSPYCIHEWNINGTFAPFEDAGV